MGTIQTYDQDGSAEQRLYMWRLSWAMALEHPVVGGGAGWSYNVSHVNQEFAGSRFHWPFGGQDETVCRSSPLPVAITSRYGVVAREEAYLERRFEDAYRGYRARVRRWL